MKKIAVLLALLITGCGKVKLEHEVKGKVDPVDVKHYIVLDTNALTEYYKTECGLLFTAQEEIDACASQKLSDFMAQFTYKT
jgi:hypothetical protein